MTAIIGFAIEGHPFLFGDLLVSGTDIGESITLPTVECPKEFQPNTTSSVARGMLQKVYVINPKLMVAFAGHVGIANGILALLKDRYERSTPTDHELNDFFSAIPKTTGAKIAMLAALTVSETTTYFLGYNACSFEHPIHGTIRLAGTGTDELYNLFGKPMPLSSAGEPLNRLATGYGITLTAAGHFLAKEACTGITLKNGFGGGFEIATRTSDGFSKLEDFVTVLWLAREEPDGSLRIQFPERIIRNKYAGETLYVRAVTFPEGKCTDRTYLVNPTWSGLETGVVDNANVPELQAPWICHQFVVLRSNGLLAPRSRITFTNLGSVPPLNIGWKNGKLDLQFKSDYFDILKEFSGRKMGSGSRKLM